MNIESSPWMKQLEQRSPVQRFFSHGLFAVGLIVVIAAVLAIGYNATIGSITLKIDGETRVVRTNQRSIENILRDADISILPEDLVVPDYSATLNDHQSTITVQHARSITIDVDGQTKQFRSRATALAEIFKQANIKVGTHDRISVNGRVASQGSDTTQLNAPSVIDLKPVTIQIKRAVPIEIGSNAQKLESAADTIGQALAEANVQVYLADRITPDLATPLQSNLQVVIEPSMPINVQVDGQLLKTRTRRSTVGEVLNDLGVTLLGEDYTQPATDAAIEAGATVNVVRVREEFLIEQEPIPFNTETVADDTLELDTSSVTAGQSGIKQKRIRVRFENGQEVARNVADEFVLQPPVSKVYRYGTQIVVRTLDTPDGPIQYWRHFRAHATSYSASTSGTPSTAKYYGRTVTGQQMRKGVIAVDKSVILLFTNMYVPGYGFGQALDTGGAIQGKRLDLGYDDNNLALWYRWVDVYLLAPAPDASRITYVLPDWPVEPGR
jgi:resuscitation-promoting factor RpfB